MANPEYKVECPAFNTSCDISSCPRYLCETNVDIDKDGRLIASGFCHQVHLRYFERVEAEKISLVQSEGIPEVKAPQDTVSNSDILSAIAKGFQDTNAHTTAKSNEIKRILRNDETRIKEDKRTPAERAIINIVIWKYLAATDAGNSSVSFSAICAAVFRKYQAEKKTLPFDTKGKLRDAAKYDLENFYNRDAELAKIRSGQVTV